MDNDNKTGSPIETPITPDNLKNWQTLEIEASGNLSKTLESVNGKLGTSMVPRLDGYHLTIITPPESGKLKDLTQAQIEELQKISSDIQNGKGIAISGVGFIDGTKAPNIRQADKNKKTCFLAIDAPELTNFRREIGLPDKDLHVTLGFENGDIHMQDDKLPIPKKANPSLAEFTPKEVQFGGIAGQEKQGVLSFTRQDLDRVLDRPDHTPEDVVNLLEPDFHGQLDKGVGVWEGYTLRQHTVMMMNQYRRYFYEKGVPEGVDRRRLEFVFALHDIGKPEALENGGKHLQHEFTAKILKATLTKLQFTPQEINLAVALVDGDPIGSYIQYSNPQSPEKVIDMARSSGLPLRDFWNLLKIYYQSDAGSYTEDSGGIEALDFLFEFNHDTDTMTFSDASKGRVEELEKKIFQ